MWQKVGGGSKLEVAGYLMRTHTDRPSVHSLQRGVLVRLGLCRLQGQALFLPSIKVDASYTSSPCSFFTTCWADRTFVLLMASQSASGDNSSLHLTTHLDLFMTNVKLMTPFTFSSSSSHSFLVTCQMQSAGKFVYNLHI